MAAGLVILPLLGLHMVVMHLDGLVGIFNPAGGHPIDWANVAARAQSLFIAVTYVLLLGAALFHDRGPRISRADFSHNADGTHHT